MSILAGNRAEHSKRRRDGVATAFDSELHNLCRVEVDRVWRKRRAGRMLNPLIDRQDRDITCSVQSSMFDERLKVSQNLWIAVCVPHNTIHKIRTRQVELFPCNPFTLVSQQ